MPLAEPDGGPYSGNHRSRLGTWAEELAAAFLTRQGATIVGRNIKVGQGEVDIVAIVDGERTVVEVRSVSSQNGRARSSSLQSTTSPGPGLPAPHPLDAFDRAKVVQVKKLARALDCRRVDLVAVRVDQGGAELHWVKRISVN